MLEYVIFWQPCNKEEKYPVGILTYNEIWSFYYVDDIEEVISKGFRPFTELPDITKEYRSQKNFKSFEHRLETLETPIDLETDNIILEKVKVKK